MFSLISLYTLQLQNRIRVDAAFFPRACATSNGSRHSCFLVAIIFYLTVYGFVVPQL